MKPTCNASRCLTVMRAAVVGIAVNAVDAQTTQTSQPHASPPPIPAPAHPAMPVPDTIEIADGPFRPTVESLQKYECPEWFRDAKFGLWSHWGPQAVPMQDGWYARKMYIEGSDAYRLHLEHGQGTRDSNGVMQGNARFPDMKVLGDYVHSRGLKYGIYSSPGPKTCGQFAGSFGHEALDAKTYAAWGADYVKYDWCSYESVAARNAGEQYAALLPDSADRVRAIIAERIPLIEDRTRPRPAPQVERIRQLTDELDALIAPIPKEKRDAIQHELFVRPYKVFGDALREVDRDIIYSLCQYGMGNPGEWAPSVGGNLWRTTRDITPRWTAIRSIIDRQTGLDRFVGPGRWNDPDMLEIGNGELTPDEMHLQMTAWCMLAAPLLIGTDLTKLDALTLSILTNDEVIAVDQDELGRQAVIAKKDGEFHTWTKPLADGTTAVAVFNRSDVEANITVKLADIGLAGECNVRDLWRQRDVGKVDAISVRVGPHGAEMVKVEATQPSTAPGAK